MQTKPTFGFPAEWEYFNNKHSKFLINSKQLYGTLEKIFIREFSSDKKADSVVFYLGRLCAEDFNEILLLCANGYGYGGMKLLRSLFERAVTAGYIAKNPICADAFLEYGYIHERKLFNHAKKIIDINKLFGEKKIQQVEDSFQGVKNKFQEKICKKCGTTRIQNSWSKLDIATMAKASGMEKLYSQCYFDPTLQAHPTVASLTLRMKEKVGGGISFDEGPQREKANLTLMNAHLIMLHVIGIQNDYFKLNLEHEIETRSKDFQTIWK